MADLKCFARVRLTVEVALSQPWDPAEKLENVHRQAVESAELAVNRLLANPTGGGIRIVGKPEVDMITSRKAE